jgi:hypothetical protein
MASRTRVKLYVDPRDAPRLGCACDVVRARWMVVGFVIGLSCGMLGWL